MQIIKKNQLTDPQCSSFLLYSPFPPFKYLIIYTFINILRLI